MLFKPKNIAQDKWKHFLVGIALGIGFQLGGSWLLPLNLPRLMLANILSVIVIAYGFELFSLVTGKGHYEVMDAVASLIGGIAGMTLIVVLNFLNF